MEFNKNIFGGHLSLRKNFSEKYILRLGVPRSGHVGVWKANLSHF